MKRLLLCALAATTALLVLAARPESQGAGAAALAPGPVPVVVDTDLSTDDVLALLYVLRRPELDLRAVTVSGTGLVHCPGGARQVLALLALAGRTDVPVACGRTTPLAGVNELPSDWRRAADGFFGLDLPPSSRPPEADGAVALLARTVAGSPRPLTLLSLGPMTNVAGLLRARADLRAGIAGITAMAGAVRTDGNMGTGHERVEANAWLDATAASEVLGSRVPLTLVPLDATNQVPVTVSFASALRRYHYATAEATAAWEVIQNTAMHVGGQYFWDVLAAATLVRPSLTTVAPLRVRVVTTAGPNTGRTVESATGAEIRVALTADRPGFERHLLETWLGGAPYVLPAIRPVATITFDGRSCRYTGARRLQPRQLVFETVNRSDRTFAAVFGKLSFGKTAADLRAAVRRNGGVLKASSWFTPAERPATTPPRSTMTWLGYGDPGRIAVACAVTGPRRAWVAGTITVTSG